MRNAILAAITISMACGGGGGDTPDSPPGTPDAMVGVTVPDPGNGAIPFSWPDTEPNDSADHAVPVGTSTGAGEATWFDGTAQSGSLGGADVHDYFVFRSSPQGGNFHNGPCWNGTTTPNLMDFAVYQVDGGAVGAMVASSTTTDPNCENTTGTADFAMQPSTVYLLDLHATAGVPVEMYAA